MESVGIFEQLKRIANALERIADHTTLGEEALARIERALRRTPRAHTKDEDCDVDPATGTCRECGVGHDGVPCPECGGDAFHKDGCSLVEVEITRKGIKRSVLDDVRAILDGVRETKAPAGSELSRVLFEVEGILAADLGNPVWASPHSPEGRRS